MKQQHALSDYRVDQTIFASDPLRLGNCIAACVATALMLPLDRVPHFLELAINSYGDDMSGDHWHAMFIGFVAGHGFWPHYLAFPDDAEPGEIVFASGMSPRGVRHQVLYLDGQLWHDPHPSRAGIETVDEGESFTLRPISFFDHTPTALAAS